MKKIYSYRLIECLQSRGFQIGSRGMHGNSHDNWHPNDLCIEYDDCLYTIGLNLVSNLVDCGLVGMKYHCGELYQLFGIKVHTSEEYTRIVLMPICDAVIEYLTGIDL